MAALKILILTDFSDLSKVAINYGLSMSGKLEAEYTILNIVRLDGVPKSHLKMKQIENSLFAIAQEEGKKLVEESIRQTKCKAKVTFKAIKSHKVADTVGRYVEANKINLVVMGSRGASRIKKAVLGGTTVSVIDVCDSPVLAIPEKAEFTNFKHVVYASDLRNVQKELDTIIPFARIFGSTVHMVHVVEAIDKNVDARREEASAMVHKADYSKISLEVVIDDNVPVAIDKYLKEKKGDVLTTFTHELNLFEKIFARSVTRKLAYQGIIPLLTFKRRPVKLVK
ncbi:MAG: universal stress protein [Cyclobacteriaceae bacterium]